MTIDLGQLNWLAVIVGALVYFALGALWYSPMFLGKAWQRSIGWDESRTPPEQSPMTYQADAVSVTPRARRVAGRLAAASTNRTASSTAWSVVIPSPGFQEPSELKEVACR